MISRETILTCTECEKETIAEKITVHGTCWKCHLGSVSLNTHIIARIPSGNRFKDYLEPGQKIEIMSGPDAGKTFE